MDSGKPQEEILILFVCVRTCNPQSHTTPVSACGCLSARVCTNECVGTQRASGGRMPFPHPCLPIISRPDKTPVCWRMQDQTVMSRQLTSQHTADARWLSLSWVLGYMQYASGGQLIQRGSCDMPLYFFALQSQSQDIECSWFNALFDLWC